MNLNKLSSFSLNIANIASQESNLGTTSSFRAKSSLSRVVPVSEDLPHHDDVVDRHNEAHDIDDKQNPRESEVSVIVKRGRDESLVAETAQRRSGVSGKGELDMGHADQTRRGVNDKEVVNGNEAVAEAPAGAEGAEGPEKTNCVVSERPEKQASKTDTTEEQNNGNITHVIEKERKLKESVRISEKSTAAEESDGLNHVQHARTNKTVAFSTGCASETTQISGARDSKYSTPRSTKRQSMISSRLSIVSGGIEQIRHGNIFGNIGIGQGIGQSRKTAFQKKVVLSASKKKTKQSLHFMQLDDEGNAIVTSRESNGQNNGQNMTNSSDGTNSITESLSSLKSEILHDQLTLHLRYLGFSLICALPVFFAICSATFFVAPGYEPCNLGKESCDLEYGLNTILYTLFVCSFLYVGVPCLWDHEKFMGQEISESETEHLSGIFPWKACPFPLKYAAVRFLFPWMIFQLAIQSMTGNDWKLASIYLILVRLSSSALFIPWCETVRFHLGYSDWYHPLRMFSFPLHPTWKERVDVFYGLVFIMLAALAWPAYACLDAAYIATGEWGSGLQRFRAPIFFVFKRVVYLTACFAVRFFKEPVLVAGRIRQLIPWSLHILLGIVTPMFAMNASSWMALFEFIVFDCLALLLRFFAFSEIGDGIYVVKRIKDVLRFQKMSTVSEMKLRELRGWELIVESVAMQIIYLALLMFYVFAHVFLNHHDDQQTHGNGAHGNGESHAGTKNYTNSSYNVVYRFWFPYEHSFPGLLILLAVDLMQDLAVRHYVVKETGCSFNFLMGQPVFSYMTKVSMLCVGSGSFTASLVSQFAYVFEKEGLGVFKPDSD